MASLGEILGSSMVGFETPEALKLTIGTAQTLGDRFYFTAEHALWSIKGL